MFAGRDQRAVDVRKIARMLSSAFASEWPPSTSARIAAISSRM
jgi:hypothetical protein